MIGWRGKKMNYVLDSQDNDKVTFQELVLGKKTLVVFLRHLG
jgi:hypothetical protein